MSRGRSRASAKAAGGRFERAIANHLAAVLNDERIDRRVRMGSADRGDIAGVRCHGQRLVIECKDTARLALASWVAEAAIEAGNDDALAGVVVHKRHGVGYAGDQWVTMTVDTFVAVITGQRPVGEVVP